MVSSCFSSPSNGGTGRAMRAYSVHHVVFSAFFLCRLPFNKGFVTTTVHDKEGGGLALSSSFMLYPQLPVGNGESRSGSGLAHGNSVSMSLCCICVL